MKDIYSPDYKNEKKEAVKNIDVVKHLENENQIIEESLKNVKALKLDIENFNMKLQEDIDTYKKQNESLQEQNRVLEDKVTDLQEKLTHSPNMSDYEQIKKENVELKKENSILRRMFNNAVELINSQIERLLGTGKEGRTEKYTEKEARDMAEHQIKNNNTPVTPVAKKEDYDYSNDWGMQR
jgi:uncharacterized protein YdiU (UPF0061 family)